MRASFIREMEKNVLNNMNYDCSLEELALECFKEQSCPALDGVVHVNYNEYKLMKLKGSCSVVLYALL
ncbi:unnamed protein product [Cylicostephanus goldi]|uniref:Uncharacterized protein n=1 Tax=Cylicostephanus goldi TaxID=71465 RepID=A0A3P7Q2A7_CYLGO|nr:unnamed protein product [Cylicostephanus goldi]